MMRVRKNGDNFVVGGKVQCDTCGGTGVYVGTNERDGAAVVCLVCDGKGYKHVNLIFTEFTGRKRNPGVDRVYRTAGPHCISAVDAVNKDLGMIRFSKSGATYDDWLTGEEPEPIRDLHCPYMDSDQTMQSEKHEGHAYYRAVCSENLSLGGQMTDCKMYRDKHKCWKAHDMGYEAYMRLKEL